MPKFKMEVLLPVDTDLLSNEILNMTGVNGELAPLLKMTSPKAWATKPISEWPTHQRLFSSRILLLGIVPIDIHRFQFTEVGKLGFKETSTTLMNKAWSHERTLSANESGTRVIDTVYFNGRIKWLDALMKPVYEFVFARRHKRLSLRFGKRF